MTAAAVVTAEPRTYTAEARHSFFADLVAVHSHDDFEAAQRLLRHRRETGDGTETRTNPNTTAGTGGEFTVPLWLTERFQTAARAGRVLGDLVNRLPLPERVSSINWPTMSTGADANIQNANAAPVDSVDQVTGSAVNPAVVTIAGDADSSQQLYDLTPSPGYDGIVYADLCAAYNANLEKQLLNGTGTNGQLTGVQQIAKRNADVVGSTATTIATTFDFTGRALAAVGNNRLLPATTLLMAPRRWAWIGAQVDDQHRPILTPDAPHPDESDPAGGVTTVGRILGKPVYEDGAIPAGTSTDVIVALRPSDLWLYESEPKFAIDQGVTAGTLQVRLQLRRYVNFQIPYPTGITVVTAIPAPANY